LIRLASPLASIGRARWVSALAIAAFFGPAAFANASAPSQDVRPCTAPEFHQFDFWLGDWDAADYGTTEKSAHVRVESILGGCVLHEIYQGADGHLGESFSLYVSPRGVWRQTWVTNKGEYLTIQGTLKAGAIDLVGTEEMPGGKQRLVRGIWKPERSGVRETATRSTDGGKTWAPWFDLLFSPHRL
jgi:hypothetical protein